MVPHRRLNMPSGSLVRRVEGGRLRVRVLHSGGGNPEETYLSSSILTSFRGKLAEANSYSRVKRSCVLTSAPQAAAPDLRRRGRGLHHSWDGETSDDKRYSTGDVG